MNIDNKGDGMMSQQAQVSLISEQATGLIIEQARHLVNQLIEKRGHDKPPFLSREFARLRGIKEIVEADLGKTSAILLRTHDGYLIKVNQNHRSVRKNFSCAHEIGHILLNEANLENYVQSIEYRTFNPQAERKARSEARERLCDIAATELLMPESVFRKYLAGFGVSVHSIERLASVFKVSFPSAAMRIAEVSPEPCLALLWKPILGTKSKLLKLAWCVGSGIKLPSRAYYMPVYTNIRYTSEDDRTVKCRRKFKHGTAVKRLPMESKGFGYGETRYVISLVSL